MNSKPLRTVDHVDLDRYMGRWNVIAAKPMFLERGKVGTADIYARRADGKIDVTYAFRKKTLSAPEEQWKGVAWVTDAATRAEWKVRMMWPLTADYQIIDLAADYSWAVVASRNGKWLWVLARSTVLPDGVYRDIEQRIRTHGLDPTELVKVPQPAS